MPDRNKRREVIFKCFAGLLHYIPTVFLHLESVYAVFTYQSVEASNELTIRQQSPSARKIKFPEKTVSAQASSPVMFPGNCGRRKVVQTRRVLAPTQPSKREREIRKTKTGRENGGRSGSLLSSQT
jgi:hypothetical protein